MPVSSLPSLRFFDFTDKWSESDLQEVSAKNISYGIVQTGEYVDDGVPCIRVMDLTKEKINTNELIKTSVEISQSYKKTILEKDELMIALRGEIGLTKLVNSELEGCNLTRGVARVSPKLDIIDPRFLELYLNSESSRDIFDKRKNGSALKEIPISELKKIPVRYPKLSEQQKIADFLTAVDSKISQLTEKNRLLNEYKKGVMQQLFSQRLRFKDENGNAFPEWEERPLNVLASKCTEKNKGRLVKDALTNSAKHGIIAQQDYFDKDIANADNTDNYYVVNIDDFVYNPRISEYAPVGPIGRNHVKKGVMSPLYSVFRFKNNVNLDFIEYFFKGSTWYRYMNSVANFGARHDRMNISSADLMSLPCPYPCLAEQQKIAQFLQSIDNKIVAVAEQIEQTKQFKKGLLQQMFV
ncbi:restriction endonuclease subunit S [Shewanella sp. DNRA4]|uniref:restriction endonuclease subunit S n=1 Tax=Shewanella sp. DNRA4 TaxID=2723055 RepID=UPI00146C4124|nr:restriction endonuclease subunit S [Shewanella sp. DNRA4]NMD51673.1 restriction endonuclease subunit S [Shewanella sp. DNRA4]